jgi:hypothetical protein
MYHPSLLTPETRQKDINSRAAVPQTFEMKLEAACIAYHRTDLEVAYYGTKQPDPKMQQIVRETRDRKLIDLRPLLEKLVLQ